MNGLVKDITESVLIVIIAATLCYCQVTGVSLPEDTYRFGFLLIAGYLGIDLGLTVRSRVQAARAPRCKPWCCS